MADPGQSLEPLYFKHGAPEPRRQEWELFLVWSAGFHLPLTPLHTQPLRPGSSHASRG